MLSTKTTVLGNTLSTIWGFYFKSRNLKFPPTWKNRVFCVADFFENRGNGGLILGVRPKNVFVKTYVSIRFPEKKNEKNRWQTREVIGGYFSPNVFTKHGTLWEFAL